MLDLDRTDNSMPCLDDFYERMVEIKCAKSIEEVITSLKKVYEKFSIENFVIADIPNVNERLNSYLFIDGWPEEWSNRYLAENYVHSDPIVSKIVNSYEPFVWSEALYTLSIDRRGRKIMTEARDVGMVDGFSVPIHLPRNGKATVSLGGRSVDFSPVERSVLHLFSVFSYSSIKSLINSGVINKNKSGKIVTANEREIIYWCAEGKTTWEIAKITGKSHKTVQHTIANVQSKMNAVNRVQLIAESIRSGIIR